MTDVAQDAAARVTPVPPAPTACDLPKPPQADPAHHRPTQGRIPPPTAAGARGAAAPRSGARCRPRPIGYCELAYLGKLLP